jgi:hypothetical protein
MAFFVDLREVSERLRCEFARGVDPAFIEGPGANGVFQIVQRRVGICLRCDLAIGPLLEADPHVPEARPPCVLATVAGAALVFTQLVEAHGLLLVLRYSSVHRTVIRGVILNTWRMPFQPGVDPLRLEANRSPSADARVPELLALARGVDRVPAHTGVLRTFAHR